MFEAKTVLNRKYRFWLFQIVGWLLFGIIDLYASSQMTGPFPMSGKHVLAWALSLIVGFCITLLIRPFYRFIYLKRQSIISYTLISLACTLLGSFLWLTIKDLSERVIDMRVPYSIWSQSHQSGFIDYITVNILFLSVPLFAWSFLYFGYKLVYDLNVERHSGPYRIVRHPMYSGAFIVFIFMPLALGSFWAIFPFLFGVPESLVWRIISEETYLVRNLSGYKDYCQKTKYSLIPFIW